MIKKRIFYEENAPQARFFIKNTMRRRQDLSNKMRRRPEFDSVLMGALSCSCSKKIVFHEIQLRIFFF